MPFQVSYSAGGVVDELRKLPYPYFPSKTTPYVKGFRLFVPAQKGIYEVTYVPESDMDLTGVAVASTGYADFDYWELQIGDLKLFESIYTKELPEVYAPGALGAVVPVPAGTTIAFRFHNESATSKIVWPELRFLR